MGPATHPEQQREGNDGDLESGVALPPELHDDSRRRWVRRTIKVTVALSAMALIAWVLQRFATTYFARLPPGRLLFQQLFETIQRMT